MRQVIAVAVAMVLACSTVWGQSAPYSATGVVGAVSQAVSSYSRTLATADRAAAIAQWDAASTLIQQWNPNVGDYQAMADIVLLSPNPDPMQATMVWMLLESIQGDVAEMWGLTGEAITLREQAHVDFLIGDSYFFDGLWASADGWFVKSITKSGQAAALMTRSMELRMQVLEQVEILLDLVGP